MLILSNIRSYKHQAKIGISVLWTGAALLLLLMLYIWIKGKPDTKSSNSWYAKPQTIFIDQLLLTASDLTLEKSAGLINITLNKEMTHLSLGIDSIINTAPERKVIYSNILKQKIKNMTSSSSPDDADVDFIIKPLPK